MKSFNWIDSQKCTFKEEFTISIAVHARYNDFLMFLKFTRMHYKYTHRHKMFKIVVFSFLYVRILFKFCFISWPTKSFWKKQTLMTFSSFGRFSTAGLIQLSKFLAKFRIAWVKLFGMASNTWKTKVATFRYFWGMKIILNF